MLAITSYCGNIHDHLCSTCFASPMSPVAKLPENKRTCADRKSTLRDLTIAVTRCDDGSQTTQDTMSSRNAKLMGTSSAIKAAFNYRGGVLGMH